MLISINLTCTAQSGVSADCCQGFARAFTWSRWHSIHVFLVSLATQTRWRFSSVGWEADGKMSRVPAPSRYSITICSCAFRYTACMQWKEQPSLSTWNRTCRRPPRLPIPDTACIQWKEQPRLSTWNRTCRRPPIPPDLYHLLVMCPVEGTAMLQHVEQDLPPPSYTTGPLSPSCNLVWRSRQHTWNITTQRLNIYYYLYYFQNTISYQCFVCAKRSNILSVANRMCLLSPTDTSPRRKSSGMFSLLIRTWRSSGFWGRTQLASCWPGAVGDLSGTPRPLTLRVNAFVANSPVLTGAVRVDTDTQRCTGRNQDHQLSQGQYEWILTPSAALATNRTISSHRGSMSVYSHPALHWPQTGPSVITGAVRVDTDTQRCTGHKQDHQFSQGQYEWILTPSAALATNRTISSHRRGSTSGYWHPALHWPQTRSPVLTGAVRVDTDTQRCTGHKTGSSVLRSYLASSPTWAVRRNCREVVWFFSSIIFYVMVSLTME